MKDKKKDDQEGDDQEDDFIKKMRISTCSIAAVLGFKEIIYTYLTLLGDSFVEKNKDTKRS